ncbi:MAG: AMP-binding protein, partial [Thermoanaerobaculia bacterium]
PAAMILAALADGLAAWTREPRFTVELSLTGTPFWVPLELDGAAPGPFGERARAVQERVRRDLAWPLPRSLRPEGLPPLPVALPVAITLPPRLFREDMGEEERAGRTRGRTEARLLHLQVAEREGGLLLLWDVAEPGFPEGMAEALTVACRDLLRRLSAAPAWQEVRRRAIPPQQLARMVAFNTTGAPVPEPYLYELFASRARRQPERTAVTGATYGELLRASERLGHLLQREGARRNTPVAVVLEPGREAVAAILGVLAAGAAWLPVDPGLPRGLFRALLEHGRIELAVTREALADTLDWPEEIVGIMIEDTVAEGLPEGPPPVPSASPKDLACVLSGVMLENRGIANLALDLAQRFGMGPADRTLARSLSEGTSLFEIFGTLATGGTVVFEEAEGITVATAPDRVVLRSGRTALLRGSLETTVWTAVSEDGSSFGRPLSNQSVHILDARLELCPFWVPGDLYVGGLGLARGYWRDPARSAERFTVHPDTGERLFRTGLRARWVAGGEVELLP